VREQVRHKDEARDRAKENMDAATNSLERLIMTYNDRIARYVELLIRFRREIEAYWDRD
jgi:hypothetical protein